MNPATTKLQMLLTLTAVLLIWIRPTFILKLACNSFKANWQAAVKTMSLPQPLNLKMSTPRLIRLLVSVLLLLPSGVHLPHPPDHRSLQGRLLSGTAVLANFSLRPMHRLRPKPKPRRKLRPKSQSRLQMDSTIVMLCAVQQLFNNLALTRSKEEFLLNRYVVSQLVHQNPVWLLQVRMPSHTHCPSSPTLLLLMSVDLPVLMHIQAVVVCRLLLAWGPTLLTVFLHLPNLVQSIVLLHHQAL